MTAIARWRLHVFIFHFTQLSNFYVIVRVCLPWCSFYTVLAHTRIAKNIDITLRQLKNKYIQLMCKNFRNINYFAILVYKITCNIVSNNYQSIQNIFWAKLKQPNRWSMHNLKHFKIGEMRVFCRCCALSLYYMMWEGSLIT